MRSDTVYHLLKRIAKEEVVDDEIKEGKTIKLDLTLVLTSLFYWSNLQILLLSFLGKEERI